MRPVRTIAQEVMQNWKVVSPYAKPYLDAMLELNSIQDNYYADSGFSVVAYFLSNAQSWHGDKAREIKKELNLMLKEEFKKKK